MGVGGRTWGVRQVCGDRPFPILLLIESTANLPDESITPLSTVAKPGVYFGYAQVIPPAEASSSSWRKEDRQVLPMAMSMGWNPYYKNEKLTCVSIGFAAVSDAKVLTTPAGDSHHARLPH